ncbi:MAG: sugar phosphate isomerase/epimerase [Spirochaetes bacterium]|nr:sugar phosphate isomerase/epimerase [Spirochaetota bacterium]
MKAKPISLQLYTLREASAKDFPAVIKAVGDIGYTGVEPAGFHGLKPRELRKLVEDQGMTISSSHSPKASPDTLSEVIDTTGELGVDLVSCGFGQEDFKDMAAIRATAEKVNLMYERLRAAGRILFLHNHWWEFEKIDGRLKYDVFAELAPSVSFELDTYWAASFGAVDTAAVLKRYARRTPLLHIKDGPLVRDKPMVSVGKGKMIFRPILSAADPAVLRWLVVELDDCATDILQAVKESYDWLVGQGMATGRKPPAR